MFPDVRFLGLSLYEWCLLLGAVAALVVARVLAGKRKVPASLQTLILIDAFFSILGGYGCAILFQALYNLGETGVFALNGSTGSTFYGGLIGGAAIFLCGYFLIGKAVCKELPVQYFKETSDLAACAIVLAHCIGRLGCFFAGCCYGKPTNAWFGILFPALGEKVVPTQLFECIFLLLLFAVLLVLFFKTDVSCLGVYLTVYAVFRFVIEFQRGDDRGSLGIPLSPSQLVAIVLFAVGVACILLFAWKTRRKKDAK